MPFWAQGFWMANTAVPCRRDTSRWVTIFMGAVIAPFIRMNFILGYDLWEERVNTTGSEILHTDYESISSVWNG
jgi:hypothetical protein